MTGGFTGDQPDRVSLGAFFVLFFGVLFCRMSSCLRGGIWDVEEFS